MSKVKMVRLYWRYIDGGAGGFTTVSINDAPAFARKLNAEDPTHVHWWQAPNKASTPTAGMHRQKSKSKSKASSVKTAGSPSGG
ncbi:MAG TPA: hypothetical protein VK206_10385 [Anaerolineales bacterium]|nr:hypothetical protein [Anaerolineales bacterium]